MNDGERTSRDESPAAHIDATDDGRTRFAQNGGPGPKVPRRVDALPTTQVERNGSCTSGPAAALRARCNRTRRSIVWADFVQEQLSADKTKCSFVWTDHPQGQ